MTTAVSSLQTKGLEGIRL